MLLTFCNDVNQSAKQTISHLGKFNNQHQLPLKDNDHRGTQHNNGWVMVLGTNEKYLHLIQLRKQHPTEEIQ